MRIDEIAKTASAARRAVSPAATGLNAKAAPRRTIPSAASVNGTKSVDMIAAKAGGNAVQRMARSKMDRDEDRLEELEGGPSTANGIPNAPPNRPIMTGHSHPISNDHTVPVTAPTAKVTAMTVDHRWARRSAAESPRRSPIALAIRMSVGSPTPRQARMMWNPRVNAIWERAASRFEATS